MTRWNPHQILTVLVGTQCILNGHPHLIVERKFLSGLALKFMWPLNIIHFTTCTRTCSTFSFMVWHGQSQSCKSKWGGPHSSKTPKFDVQFVKFPCQLVKVNFTQILMKSLTIFHSQLHIHFLAMGLNGKRPHLVMNLDTRRLTLNQVS